MGPYGVDTYLLLIALSDIQAFEIVPRGGETVIFLEWGGEERVRS